MDAFAYLSVLLSIIIGLGMTQILTSLGPAHPHAFHRGELLAAAFVVGHSTHHLRSGLVEHVRAAVIQCLDVFCLSRRAFANDHALHGCGGGAPGGIA